MTVIAAYVTVAWYVRPPVSLSVSLFVCLTCSVVQAFVRLLENNVYVRHCFKK